MLRPIFLLLLFFLVVGQALGQDTATPATPAAQSANCTQVLRLARAVYEQGRLHELEKLLEGCLAGEVGTTNGFSTIQERVDAYRLLCLSYIYLEEPVKADQAMLGILNTDHFFTLNPTDPAEFQALYKTFRTEPVFNWGAKIAGNVNIAHLQTVYSVASGSAGHAKYLPGVSFSAGAFIEKEFFPKAKEGGFLNNTYLRADIYYMARGNKIQYERLWRNETSDDPEFNAAIGESKLSTAWIDLHILARYRYMRKSLWDPYVGVAAGNSVLLGAKVNLPKFEWQQPEAETSGEIIRVRSGSSYSGPAVDAKPAFNSLLQSASLVWGVNRKAGQLYFNIEARYQYVFTNPINGSKRTLPDLIDYAITLNDYSQSNFIVNIGVTVPYFSPKKLSKKK